ncbi:very long chain fatty acid elongase AAEL008004 [Anabrus simplex]|uniref:very long chain fatty acid elongase AAEL008004 n=1 Tax=Anabrus simplex TaxID=316456 RepID=UPI0035A3A28C
MAALLRALAKGYHVVNDEWSDERTKDYWFIGSPLPITIIITSYVYFSRNLGPRLMADRKPFQLEWIIRVFDLTQIVANLYIFERCISLAWGGTYNWWCEPLDYSRSPHAMAVVNGVYAYFIIKIVDLLDTVFFILKKKDGHVSFLHVYHHGGMVFASWFAVKYMPGGHATFLGLLNSFVHAVMYTYYFWTSMYPEYKKYIWWKKHITQLQMLQFLLIMLHAGQLFVANPCKYPIIASVLLVPQNLFMLILFYDFYRKAYRPTKLE